jgi:DNA polymerase III gamma/tau subunit
MSVASIAIVTLVYFELASNLKCYLGVIMKIWQLVCGSVLVLSMTSCGNKTATTPSAEKTPAPEAATAPAATPAPEASPATAPTSSATTPAPEAAAPTATATGSGFPALKSIVAATKKAGEAANFDVATTEFSKFEDVWKTVEDKVKTKTPGEYKSIETTLEAANMALAKKDKSGLLTNLTKLSGFLDKAGK